MADLCYGTNWKAIKDTKITKVMLFLRGKYRKDKRWNWEEVPLILGPDIFFWAVAELEEGRQFVKRANNKVKAASEAKKAIRSKMTTLRLYESKTNHWII